MASGYDGAFASGDPEELRDIFEEFDADGGGTIDIDELGDRLTELYRLDDERPATIDARPGTIYSDVIKVLDKALAAGYRDITFVGAYDPKKK